MRRTFLILMAAAGLLSAQSAPTMSTTLKVGDTAPDFTLPATAEGKNMDVKLSDFRGKKSVILAFFPAAFTGGCTQEVRNYNAKVTEIAGADAQIFGISTDNRPSLAKFAEQEKLTFPLISDFKDRSVSKAYGVLNENSGVARRVTFVIGLDGKIAHMEENKDAIDANGAVMACKRIKKS